MSEDQHRWRRIRKQVRVLLGGLIIMCGQKIVNGGEAVMGKDDCSRCRGERGGIPGNENVKDGMLVCDYCTADEWDPPRRRATDKE